MTITGNGTRPASSPGEAQAAGGRLLGGREDARRGVVHGPRDEVGPVVEQHVRVGREDAPDVPVVGLGVVRLERVDPEVLARRHRGRDPVVGRGGAAGPRDLRAAREQRLHEDRRLRLDVEAHPDPPSLERPVPLQLRTQAAEHRHVRPGPRDALLALGRERRVGDEAGLELAEGDRGGTGHVTPRCTWPVIEVYGPRPYDPVMQTTRVPVADGVDLAVDTFVPDGAPADGAASFVLVHGLASNARMWDGVAARLVERGHAAATVDLRGHGRSAKPDGPYDMATVADDLAAVIGALGWERPVVAGQSWGGNVVLELANRHPDATRGIACVDGGWLEPCAAFDSWEACQARLAPPRTGRAAAERDRGLHPRRARGLARDRDRGDARQLRAAARRDDRAVAHVRPPHRGAARPVGPPPVGALRRDRRRRSCSSRRTPGRPSG